MSSFVLVIVGRPAVKPWTKHTGSAANMRRSSLSVVLHCWKRCKVDRWVEDIKVNPSKAGESGDEAGLAKDCRFFDDR